MKSEGRRENNIVILEFMGFVVKDFGAAGVRFIVKEDVDRPYYDWEMVDDCKYDTSYDWIMPVIEKIESLGATVNIGNNRTNNCVAIFYNSIDIPETFKESDNKLNSLCLAASEFIKYYNELQNN